MTKILIVEDETAINDLIKMTLSHEGYSCSQALTAVEAMNMAGKINFDLVLLDVNLPDLDGFSVYKHLGDVPVIFVTARDEIDDRLKGFCCGAEDYIVKPFDPKELVARVKAVLRRYEPKQEEVDKNRLKFGGLEINLSNYSVSYNGKSLEFPPKEFELLSFLAQHPNRVFTREQLLDRIWGYEYVGDTRTVDVHVKRIREKLNSEDEWGILTVWSVGYKFGQK